MEVRRTHEKAPVGGSSQAVASSQSINAWEKQRLQPCDDFSDGEMTTTAQRSSAPCYL